MWCDVVFVVPNKAEQPHVTAKLVCALDPFICFETRGQGEVLILALSSRARRVPQQQLALSLQPLRVMRDSADLVVFQ